MEAELAKLPHQKV